jgi:hypothetical protein
MVHDDSGSSALDFVHATEFGARSGCPFCIGRMVRSMSVGDRIVILQGPHSGASATVTAEHGFSQDEFMVHFDGQSERWETRISYSRDRFASLPIARPPTWLCHLSTDDLSVIDESVIQTADLFGANLNVWTVKTLLPILSIIRSRRLPVSGADLWPTLEAHGFPSATGPSFQDRFDYAIEILVAMVGRPPISRKKVQPMSIGRYLTPARLQELGRSPGIESIETKSDQ